MDLSLVPISDLVDEISKRSHYHVLGYSRMDKGEELFDVSWNGSYLKTLGLCSQIMRDIQNNVEG